MPLLHEMEKKEVERMLYIKARARAKLQEASLPECSATIIAP